MIYDLAQLRDEAQAGIDRFAAGVNGIFIHSDDTLKVQSAVDVLYEADKELSQTFSWEEFKREALRFVATLKIECRPPTNVDSDTFFNGLLTVPVQNFSIFRDIVGVALKTPEPLDLGPFRIYCCDVHTQVLTADSYAKQGLFVDNGNYMIRVVVRARDATLAMQVADELFARFEHVIAFIYGKQNQTVRVSAAVSNWPNRVKSYIASETVAMHVVKRLQNGGTIDLGSEDITVLDGSAKIWSILSSSNRTKMEERIVLAIDWLGQARLDMSQANAILKSAIATEILFNLKRDPIGPSISSQIAETMAHIVGGDVEIKLWIEKEMKRLYGLRSNVTHRGSVKFEAYDIHLLMRLATDAILILLTQAPYKDFANEDQLVEHLNIVKYSAPRLPPVVRTTEG